MYICIQSTTKKKTKMKNTTQNHTPLTGAWKVLFKYEYTFHVNQGKNHETAEALAMESIRAKQGVAKKVHRSEYGH